MMPVATLTLAFFTHSSTVEALESMYVKVARARGLPERLVILRHALVAVETIFAYPRPGRMLDIDDVFYRRRMI